MTEADLLALPDDGRGFELIDGELVEKQAGYRHGQAQVRLARTGGSYDQRGGGPGGPPGGWRILTEQLVRFPPNTLRPDLAGWRRERMPEPPLHEDEAVIALLPDWICEIVSPTRAAQDLVRKKRIYHQHRVPHYWIIDPRDETLTVHRFSTEGYLQVLLAERGERVRAEPFDGIELPVGILFGDEEEPG